MVETWKQGDITYEGIHYLRGITTTQSWSKWSTSTKTGKMSTGKLKNEQNDRIDCASNVVNNLTVTGNSKKTLKL